MPAESDLGGRRFGALLVIGLDRIAPHGGSLRRWWRVQCDCGREDICPQRWLTTSDPDRAFTACSFCRSPECVVCGCRTGHRFRLTCSVECDLAHTRSIGRASYHRRMSDPVNPLRSARVERHARDYAAKPPEKRAEINQARWARIVQIEEQAAEVGDRRRAKMRMHYAKDSARIQAERRARLAALTDDDLAEHQARMREYQRKAAKRRRGALAANLVARQEFLEMQAEWRRRRALAKLMSEGATIIRGDNDDNTSHHGSAE